MCCLFCLLLLFVAIQGKRDRQIRVFSVVVRFKLTSRCVSAQPLHTLPHPSFLIQQELTTSHVSSTVALGLIHSMANVDQRHFPGTLHKLIVINAPWLFQQIFGLVSSWLAPETAAVFHVLGDPLLDEDVRQELLTGTFAVLVGAVCGVWCARRSAFFCDLQFFNSFP